MIDKSVKVPEDAIIGPGVVIEKGCRIGKGFKAGPNSVILANTIIGDNVKIGASAVLGELGPCKPGEAKLTIGDGSTISPNVTLHTGSTFGKKVFIGNGVSIREHCTLGDKVLVHPNAAIAQHAKIGYNVAIQCGCFIVEHAVIGDNVFIAPNTQLLNSKAPRGVDSKKWLRPPVIGDWAVLGGGVTVHPGVRVGEYAVVGGGSNVTKDVPKEAVYVGNPAKPLMKAGKVMTRWDVKNTDGSAAYVKE